MYAMYAICVNGLRLCSFIIIRMCVRAMCLYVQQDGLIHLQVSSNGDFPPTLKCIWGQVRAKAAAAAAHHHHLMVVAASGQEVVVLEMSQR